MLGVELAPFTDVGSKVTAGVLNQVALNPEQQHEEDGDEEGGNPFRDGRVLDCIHKLANVHNKYETIKDALTGKARDPSLRLASEDLPLKLMDIGKEKNTKESCLQC